MQRGEKSEGIMEQVSFDQAQLQWTYFPGPAAGTISVAGQDFWDKWNGGGSSGITLDQAFPQPSGDDTIDALVWFGVPRWTYEIPSDGGTVYYMFPDAPIVDSLYGDPVENYAPFNDAQKTAVREIYDQASALTGLTFVETDNSSQADVFFGNSDIIYGDTIGITYSFVSYETDANGTLTSLDRYDFVFMDNVEYADTTQSPTQGTYDYEYLMHEMGHTLGLDDPYVTGLLPADLDNTDYTVMSYNAGSEGAQSSYQELDVTALGYIYGTGSRAYAAAADSSLAGGKGLETFAVFGTA